MLKVIRDGASEYQLLASTAFDQTAQDCANEFVRELVVFPRINLVRPATVECNVASPAPLEIAAGALDGVEERC